MAYSIRAEIYCVNKKKISQGKTTLKKCLSSNLEIERRLLQQDAAPPHTVRHAF